ncbi:hypothetical protein SAMN05443633_106152 [Chryseobacterium arachidis]|uniref:Uncharacterized protein n=1 Tax=Chryseobacterium arachidis TaxID=1416778 RepID=A0A1M5EAJ6_9FLAO|nr:hypothetical protein SAMN05443633_106152 [Chryseobacterium arachidis]
MMSILSITPSHIMFFAGLAMTLYITSIMILIKNKSDIIPYLVLFFFPIIGSLGIIFGNFMRKK